MQIYRFGRGHDLVLGFILVSLQVHSTKPNVDFFLNGIQMHDDFFDHTVESGENISFTCEADTPLAWKAPRVTDKKYENYTKIIVRNWRMEKLRKFVLKLEIINITFPFVGYYGCFEKKNREIEKKMYLYVHDDRHLAVIETESDLEVIYAVKYARAVIPCRPTSLDVTVSLRTPGGQKVELNTTEETEYAFDFNPHEGFFTLANSEDNALLYCLFERNNTEYEFWFKLDVEMATSYLAEPFISTKRNHFVIGETMTLECSVKSNVQTDIHWKLPSDEKFMKIIDSVVNDQERMVKSKLEIFNITSKYSGQYVCLAEDKQNHSSLTNITLFVHDPTEHFIIFMEHKHAQHSEYMIGETVSFEENFEAYPKSEATWLDNEGNIIGRHSEKYETQISETYASLKITNITYREHGNYTLVVGNSKDNRTKIYSLDIRGRPEIKLHVDEFQLPNKYNEVICKVTSNPKSETSIQYKECIDNSCEYKKMYAERRKEGLATYEKKRMIFKKSSTVKCWSKNIYGEQVKEKRIYISDIPRGFDVEINDTKTYFDEHTNTASVAVGDSVSLKCGAYIKSYHERLEWRKDSQRILAENNFILKQHELSSSKFLFLHINNITIGQKGAYSCVLMEHESVIKRIDLEMDVCKPYAPKFQSKDNGTILKNLGDYVHFNCRFIGVPKPTITWFKDREEISSSSGDVFLDRAKNFLLVRNITVYDEGEYKCEVKNRLGTEHKTWKLEIKDKPTSKIYYWLVIILLLILVVITSVIVYMKDHRKKKLEKLLKEIGLAYFEQGQLENLNPDLGLEDQAELLPYDRKWEFPPENLKIGKQLGAGAFGVVMKGEAKGIIPGEERTTVAVKMVKKDAGPTYIKALASELKIMVHLGNHLNVVNLLGACTKNVAKGQLFVIVEYCKFGNTHNYLYRHRNEFIDQIDPNTGTIDFEIGYERMQRSYSVASNKSFFPMKYVTQISTRSNNDGKSSESSEKELEKETEECKIVSMSPKTDEGEDEVLLSNNSSVPPVWRTNYRGDYKGSVRPICTKDLLIWAFQVAKGMEYLASRKVLHGDLAARNILLADENVVKICDFGLAKSMYKNDNYKKNSDCPLPIKWMAIESIRDRIFSTQSDVWSFGIVLWEFFSLARTPYPGMEADERLFAKLVDGYRMEAPEFATNEIYRIILECWSSNPLRRPSFSNLANRLGRIIGEKLQQYYIDLNDPYLKCNIQRRQDGIDDYLDRVNSPNFENLSSPNIYMNQLDHSPGYLSMKSPGINSPRPENSPVFNFETKAKKKISNASSGIQDDVFVVEEVTEEMDAEGEETEMKEISTEGFTNPSYVFPRSGNVENSKESTDKYILMTKTVNKDPCVKIEEKKHEIVYINDFSLGS